MKLRDGEGIVRVYHHHFFPFFVQMVKLVIVSLPLFFVVYLLSPLFSRSQLVIVNMVVIVVFVLIMIYMALVYWLDRMVITTQRIIYIDWKTLTLRKESEADLHDIQDFQTSEKGLLSLIPFLDYGTFQLQTASTKVTIRFEQAPDPEGIRDFVREHRSKMCPVPTPLSSP